MYRPNSSLLDGESFYLELLGSYEFTVLEGERNLEGFSRVEDSWKEPPSDLSDRFNYRENNADNVYCIAAVAVERGLQTFEQRLFDWLEKHG